MQSPNDMNKAISLIKNYIRKIVLCCLGPHAEVETFYDYCCAIYN